MEIRLRQRKGRYVEYLSEDGKWKTTGQRTKKAAFRWVEIHGVSTSSKVLFKDLAESLMEDENPGSYISICRESGQMIEDATWHNRCDRIRRCILPFFANDKVADISPRMVQTWLTTLKGKKGQTLAPGYRRLMLTDMAVIMKYAIFCGIINDNPCKKVIGISKHAVNMKSIFTEEELEKLFPESDIDLMMVWESRVDACFFMVLRDTGWRPGEAAAITPECYVKELSSIYTENSVDSVTNKIKHGIKTSAKGYTIRLGKLSARTASMLEELIMNKAPDEPIFERPRGGLFSKTITNRILNKAMNNCGVEKNGHSPYSFRTTFMTNMSKKYPDSVVMELMGHTQWHSCYDKRSPRELLEKLNDELSNTDFGGECNGYPIR